MHHRSARTPTPWLLLAVCALAGSASAQEGNCEAIRAQIEAKIAAAGVSHFSVSVVDANAGAAGQVVGQCAQGTRRIVYERQAGSPAGTAPPEAPTAAPARSPTRGALMLTECKDGTSSVGGSCRK